MSSVNYSYLKDPKGQYSLSYTAQVPQPAAIIPPSFSQVPFPECPAPGLEPYTELEQLAAQLTESKAPVAPEAPAMAPAQAKAASMAPAQPKVPPARPAGTLSDEERDLRNLLQFFACSDVNKDDPLLNLKYREFLDEEEG